jgi:hypothetical protein
MEDARGSVLRIERAGKTVRQPLRLADKSTTRAAAATARRGSAMREKWRGRR